MILPRRGLLAGGLALAVAGSASAGEAPLRIAVGVGPAASPFWTVRDASGAPQGMTVDLGRALAARLNRKAEIVAYDNSGEITEAAPRDAWDVTFVPIDAARQKLLDFGPAYDSAEASYLVRAGASIQTIAEIDRADVHVAAISNTATGRAAQASLHSAKITNYATVADVVDLLRVGTIDAFALPRGSLASLATAIPGARILPGFFARTVTAIAVPKGRPDLFVAAVAFMQDAERSGLLRDIRAQNKLP